MLQGIVDNAGTVAVCLLLAGLVALILVRLRRDKKRGKSSCGCNCGCCSMDGSCHKQSQP
ncbi:MAG: FeoB-associated Cys-rich membrane protein [Oscillospiraceae bacterium]|nr:FeoB-associated Cys-rich membrane protein [Oscillospiraceae bacterium]